MDLRAPCFAALWFGLFGSLGGATPVAPEAASAMAPYAMWVGRLPANEEATWAERRALAFRRGRLGLWLEADYQVRAARAAPARHAELCVQLARAARAAEDWARARTWLATARGVMDRVPAGERTFELVAAYYDEAIALREVTDVRVAVNALAPFLGDDAARPKNFRIYERLATYAVLVGDQENYTKAATSLLTIARAWNRESPGAAGTPSAADRAVAALVEGLLARGFTGTVRSLIESGVADSALREILLASADAAALAKQEDGAITTALAGMKDADARTRMVCGIEAAEPRGLAFWLARNGRIASVVSLLTDERDREFAADGSDARSRHERAWLAATQHAAEEFLRVGDAAAATRLGELFTSGRGAEVPSRIDLREGLVAFAAWLAEHGLLDEAQNLLATLSPDYPQLEVAIGTPEQYRAMQDETAEAVLRQRRGALAVAWALTGGAERSLELMPLLPPSEESPRWAQVRQGILAAAAGGLAVRGHAGEASDLLDQARRITVPAALHTTNHVVGLIEALVMTGNHEEAWPLVTDHAPTEPDSVIEVVITRLIARGQANRVLEWISVSPNAYRRSVWDAFFASALPDPVPWPMAPQPAQ